MKEKDIEFFKKVCAKMGVEAIEILKKEEKVMTTKEKDKKSN